MKIIIFEWTDKELVLFTKKKLLRIFNNHKNNCLLKRKYLFLVFIAQF